MTGLRGFAALYVVLYHYFPLTSAANLSNPLKRILDHGCLAVDLFFVLSGFVMALNYRRLFASSRPLIAYKTFLCRRIARIYPLYLAATFIGLCFVLLHWLDYPRTLPLTLALALNVLAIQAWGLAASFDSPAWSVSAEWAAYVVFPALLVPTIFRRPLVAWITALLCVAALVALSALSALLVQDHVHDYLFRTPLNHNGYWLALPVARCIPEFTLGLLACRLAATAFGQTLMASRWIAPTLCVGALVLLAMPMTDLAIVLLCPLVVISLGGITHLPGRLFATPLAQWLGQLSYSVYLTHKLLLGVLGWLVVRAHAAGLRHPTALAAGVCIGLTIAIAWLAYRTIEVPSRRRLRAFLERRDGQKLAAVSTATATRA